MIRTIPLSLFLIALKMGKLSHQLKQEIIDLFNSGKKAYAITGFEIPTYLLAKCKPKLENAS